MQLVKKKNGSNTGIKFVISCGYFNNADEKTHTTDLIINLNKEKPSRSFENLTEIISVA